MIPTYPQYPKIVALDFDGTICLNGWPDIKEGVVNPRCHERIYREKALGQVEFLLWTCRQDRELNDAVEWCIKNKIPIDLNHINENHPSTKEWGYTAPDARKIFAHEYWDDKAVRIV